MKICRREFAVLAFATSTALVLAACGGSDDTTTPDSRPTTSSSVDVTPSTSTSPISTTSTSTSPPIEDSPAPVFADIPADYRPPTGWIRVLDDTTDLRLEAFAFQEEGCCDAGLDADLGSPELPANGIWSDIEDGFYYAGLTGWDPNRPDVVQLSIGRVVECSSPEGQGSPYCSGEPGRFEYLRPFTPFEVPLGDFLTVKMVTYLEPTPEDEEIGFVLSDASFLGQGPDFRDLLSALHEDYSKFVVGPTADGATIADVAASLQDSPFRHVGAWNGVWERPDLPPFSYAVRQLLRYDSNSPFTAVAACYDDGERPFCLPNVSGDPEGSPSTFEYLILNSGSLHVRDGRWAFFYPGEYTAGG